jgi:ribulose-phosphate 3-epimerase
MSVNPGFGGQQFIPSALDKIAQLRTIIRQRKLSTLIQIDGGVNAGTIARISQSGVDVFVAGSAIFGSDDYAGTISELKAKW